MIIDHHHDDHQLYLIVFKAQQRLFDLYRFEVHLFCFLVSAIMMMMMRSMMIMRMMMTLTKMLMMKSPLHCLIEPAKVSVVLRCLHVALTEAGL